MKIGELKALLEKLQLPDTRHVYVSVQEPEHNLGSGPYRHVDMAIENGALILFALADGDVIATSDQPHRNPSPVS
jgi:hypothetical protein